MSYYGNTTAGQQGAAFIARRKQEQYNAAIAAQKSWEEAEAIRTAKAKGYQQNTIQSGDREVRETARDVLSAVQSGDLDRDSAVSPAQAQEAKQMLLIQQKKDAATKAALERSKTAEIEAARVKAVDKYKTDTDAIYTTRAPGGGEAAAQGGLVRDQLVSDSAGKGAGGPTEIRSSAQPGQRTGLVNNVPVYEGADGKMHYDIDQIAMVLQATPEELQAAKAANFGTRQVEGGRTAGRLDAMIAGNTNPLGGVAERGRADTWQRAANTLNDNAGFLNNLAQLDPMEARVDFMNQDHMTNLFKKGYMTDVGKINQRDRLDSGQEATGIGKYAGRYAIPVVMGAMALMTGGAALAAYGTVGAAGIGAGVGAAGGAMQGATQGQTSWGEILKNAAAGGVKGAAGGLASGAGAAAGGGFAGGAAEAGVKGLASGTLAKLEGQSYLDALKSAAVSAAQSGVSQGAQGIGDMAGEAGSLGRQAAQIATRSIGGAGINTLATGGDFGDFAKQASIQAGVEGGVAAIGEGIDRAGEALSVGDTEAGGQIGVPREVGEIGEDTELTTAPMDSNFSQPGLAMQHSPGDVGTIGSGSPVTVSRGQADAYANTDWGRGIGETVHTQLNDPNAMPGFGNVINMNPQNRQIQDPTGQGAGEMEQGAIGPQNMAPIQSDWEGINADTQRGIADRTSLQADWEGITDDIERDRSSYQSDWEGINQELEDASSYQSDWEGINADIERDQQSTYQSDWDAINEEMEDTMPAPVAPEPWTGPSREDVINTFAPIATDLVYDIATDTKDKKPSLPVYPTLDMGSEATSEDLYSGQQQSSIRGGQSPYSNQGLASNLGGSDIDYSLEGFGSIDEAEKKRREALWLNPPM